MRILYVTLGFYPALAWGGPTKVVHQNCRELVRRGHAVTVYCTNLLNKKERMSSTTIEKDIDSIHVVYFNTWNIHTWPGTLGPFWLPDLGTYLDRHIRDFDIVHVVGYRSPMSLLTVSKARRAKVPIVTNPQGTLPVMISSFFLKRLYDQLLGRKELEGISALIALQETEKKQAMLHGVPPDRIEIIPNGIDTCLEAFPYQPGDFRRVFGLSVEHPLILFLGRINKVKGVDMLVQAFAQIKDLHAQLAIVGPDDGALDDVKDLIKKLQLDDSVFLTGLVSDDTKFAAYRDADLYVLPSRSDAYPTTIIEACLAERPMLVTDRCQMAFLIRERIADVVPFDKDAFGKGLRLLLTDKKRYDTYKANCKKMMEDTFSINAVIDRLELVYQRALRQA